MKKWRRNLCMKKILILLWETKSPLHMFGKGIVIIIERFHAA